MNNTVAHVDINSYFATLLQQENPLLRGRPVGVLKSEGRSCIIAASKEAKLKGVETGSSVRDAQAHCPDIVLMPAAFERYLAATKKLKILFESFSPEVEIFSLDEAFLNYTPLGKLYSSPIEFGQRVQTRIKQVLGEWVTCNVGISYNKFLAKMAGETGAKGSVTLIDETNRDALLARTSFRDTCGIGYRLEKRLAKFGVTTPYQINFLDDAMLESAFGPFWSKELRKMGRGEEPLFLARPAVQHNAHMKSVGRSLTGFGLWKHASELMAVIHNLCEEVVYKVRAMNLAGREIGVFVVGSSKDRKNSGAMGWLGVPEGTPYWGLHVTLPHHVRHTSEMFDVIARRLMPEWQDRFPVIKVGVRLALLKPWDESPKVLWPEWWRQEKIARAVDSITDKYGLFTIKPGSMLGRDVIRPEVTGFLGDQKFQLG